MRPDRKLFGILLYMYYRTQSFVWQIMSYFIHITLLNLSTASIDGAL